MGMTNRLSLVCISGVLLKNNSERILSGTYSFPSPIWDPVSAQGKDFISKIFIVDPKKRMTASECLDHPWLNMSAEKGSKTQLNGSLLKNLGEFHRSQRDLRKKEEEGQEYSSCSYSDDEYSQ